MLMRYKCSHDNANAQFLSRTPTVKTRIITRCRSDTCVIALWAVTSSSVGGKTNVSNSTIRPAETCKHVVCINQTASRHFMLNTVKVWNDPKKNVLKQHFEFLLQSSGTHNLEFQVLKNSSKLNVK